MLLLTLDLNSPYMSPYTRMSYSGNTLAFQAKARGSIPLIRFFSYIKGFSNSALRQI